MKNQFIPAVNYHLWEPCNMRCKFCFATFQDVKRTVLPKGHLSRHKSLDLISRLAEFGFEKKTFVGGEPTLCPWLGELIVKAKAMGMVTMLVTNGSNLSDAFLKEQVGHLDWIALSIDSLRDHVNLVSGRAVSGKRIIPVEGYRSTVERIKRHGYKLKLNTVVHKLNYDEDMTEFVRFADPVRWKAFQVLPIDGQNDGKMEGMEITEEEFQRFVVHHTNTIGSEVLVAENNAAMKGSYAMVDPAGRFFDNSGGTYKYGSPILEVGVAAAFDEVNADYGKFIDRNGLYDWG